MGIPSNATTSPGSASVANSVRRSGPPKQQFVVRPSPSIGRKSTTEPSGSTTRIPCSLVDATYAAAVDVVAEAVATTVAERLDHPVARAVGVHRLETASFHHDDDTVGRERDAVAVLEVASERADRPVALEHHHATDRSPGAVGDGEDR